MNIKEHYIKTRQNFLTICKPLETEDYSVQPIDFVSPPKWHLAHTTWFFEQFVLGTYKKDYKVFNEDFAYLFNSYYNNAGERVLRPNRGLMTRPTVDEVYKFRIHIDEQMVEFLDSNPSEEALETLKLGLQHEQQHQELMYYDIKYILGHQPTFPKFDNSIKLEEIHSDSKFLKFEESVYEIGHEGTEFCFDCESGRHKVYLNAFEISNQLVTNAEYLEFIEAGGYENFNLWHAEGWDFVQGNKIKAPMYWHKLNAKWYHYNYKGLVEINPNQPIIHTSFYEAWAFAEWKGMRLPTEFEWEVASKQLDYGQLWEWTNSAFLPYPNYRKVEGALGEYNGKFMVNQMVLRGASIATAEGHSRNTYRNFFHPDMRWMFSGIRLAKQHE
jgi:ergothioneine biosynthesis protein EgtB